MYLKDYDYCEHNCSNKITTIASDKECKLLAIGGLRCNILKIIIHNFLIKIEGINFFISLYIFF